MSSTPIASFRGEGWPDDDGWALVGDWTPDPVDAVYDLEPGAGPLDVLSLSDEEVLALTGPVSAWEIVALSSIDPGSLPLDARLAYLKRMEAVKSFVAAMDARVLVAVAGTDSSDSMRDRHASMEIAQARRVGEGSASSSIATARALHVEFPLFRDALSAGEVSEWHCRILVSETAHVTDRDTLAKLQDRLLPKAKRKTPTEFRREVRLAVADLDAAREAERHALARADRYVSCTPLPNGMGHLGIVSDWPTISAMHDKVRAHGRALQVARGGAKAARNGDDDAFADASRADAFAAIVLGAEQEDGSITFDPKDIPVSLTLVMDLDTLRGEADRHALLDGEPIPSDAGRDYADAAVLRRRAVTDPVTGHLLDYGREQYLPDKLRDYILARDLCRVPGCTTRAASRLQMDHATPFPDGETSAANCGGLCVKHHQIKTDRLAHLLDTQSDGSATWITAWGQRISIPPRPFLHDPADHPPAGPPVVDPPPDPSPVLSPPQQTPPDPAPPTVPPRVGASEQMRPPTTGPSGSSSGIGLRDVDDPTAPPF